MPKPLGLVDLLNRSNPRIFWQEDSEPNQAYRRVGNVLQRVVRIGICWSWLITSDKDGCVLAGKIDWDYTPEDAAKAADDALEAASLRD